MPGRVVTVIARDYPTWELMIRDVVSRGFDMPPREGPLVVSWYQGSMAIYPPVDAEYRRVVGLRTEPGEDIDDSPGRAIEVK